MPSLNNQLHHPQNPKIPRLNALQVFTLIWFSPKKVFDFIAEYKYRDYFFWGVLPLFLMGIPFFLAGMWGKGFLHVFYSITYVASHCYLVTYLTRSRYNSIGLPRDTFYAFAYASVSNYILLLSQFFINYGQIKYENNENFVFIYIGDFLFGLSVVWSLVLSTNATASIHYITRNLAIKINIFSSIVVYLMLYLLRKMIES